MHSYINVVVLYIILMCISCFIYFLLMTLLALCVCVSHSVVSDSVTPWTVAHQAPLSKGFSRQEYWNGLPFPSPGDLPDPGIEPTFSALQADSLLSEPPGKSPQFSDIKSPLLLGRKLRHIDAPPHLYLPVQGLAYTLLLSTPSRMSYIQAAFCQGVGLRSPSGGLYMGRLAGSSLFCIYFRLGE